MMEKYEYYYSNPDYFDKYKIENITKYGVGTPLEALPPTFIENLKNNTALYTYLNIIERHDGIRSVKLQADHTFDRGVHGFKIVVRGASDSICEKAIGDIVRLIEWGNDTVCRNYHSFEEGEVVPGLEH